VYPPNTTVEDTLERDPRLAIWRHAGERLAQRPLTGFGYGRLILQDELREDTGDRLLTHAHNMFVSQALQTGAVGVALLVVLLVALLARYVQLARSGDATLRRLGTLGLAILAAFVAKNLTDDFFFRANQKLLFAVNAVLLGMAVLRERDLAPRDGGASVPPRRA
jgi:O-antigen ligase